MSVRCHECGGTTDAHKLGCSLRDLDGYVPVGYCAHHACRCQRAEELCANDGMGGYQPRAGRRPSDPPSKP